jgi:hypothetical protein
LNFVDGFSKNLQTSNFMGIPSVGAEFFPYALPDRQTDSPVEFGSKISHFGERVHKPKTQQQTNKLAN